MKNELVSALLDGECSALELRTFLDQVAQSPELLQQWSRLSQVRDVLAGRQSHCLPQVDADSFCASVMSQLGEMEALPGAQPAAARATSVPNSSNRVPLRGRPVDAAPRRVRRSRPLVGWAAAASVTLVALAGGRAWIGNGAQDATENSARSLASNGSSDEVQSASSGNKGGDSVAVSTRAKTNNEPVEVRWAQLDPDAASELNSYMIEHNNSRAEQGMSGELGYARLATRDVGYRPADNSR